MMNESAMLELEFLSKRFGLSPSSVELHVRSLQGLHSP